MTKLSITFTLLLISFIYVNAQTPAKSIAQQIESLIVAQNYDKAKLLLTAYQTKLQKVERLVFSAQIDSFLNNSQQSNRYIASLFANHSNEINQSLKDRLLVIKGKNDAHLKHRQTASESVNEIIDKGEYDRIKALGWVKRAWLHVDCQRHLAILKAVSLSARK